MTRLLVNLLTLLSLALFLACAAASVRARWVMDNVRVVDRVGPRDTYRVYLFSNYIDGFSANWSFDWHPGPWAAVEHFRRLRRLDDRRYFGEDFRMPGLRHYGIAGHPGYGTLFVAHWLVSVVTLALPVLALVRWGVRSRRLGEGRCATCGYDLRATPDRCPECGALPPDVSEAA